MGNQSYVVVIGETNILHCGFFHMIKEECQKNNFLPLFLKNERELWKRSPAGSSDVYRLAIICMGVDVFFPHWLSAFLTLLRKANGNVLIFTDQHDLLCKRKKGLLNRVHELEHVLDVSMPETYISFLVEYYLNRECSLDDRSKMSQRELAVIDGFLSGIDVVCHSTWMGITPKTLYQHRKNCANKLGVRNLKDLLRL
ncbi:hypothetical protein QMZ30_14545 [Pantoea sp. EA-12]|uniref:helix-turn-helix transcriptional regulator n=1 Tax=Pantoea sp. EA-12 TaxID=3043303 RepID=UPI0024B50BD9|nr:hypothetical protein [Pantoea sp. EA-12]MDI9222122.1 hypothetical protein [Pantoea sp. EA-12]